MNVSVGLRFLALAGGLLLVSASNPVLAPVQPVTDTYFGTAVVDPYRYMENAADPLAKRWLAGELARTRAALNAISQRAAVEEALREVPRIVSFSNLAVSGSSVFYERRDARGTTLLCERDAHDGIERVVLDASAIGSDDAPLDLGAFAPSPDGSMIAVHVSSPGDDVSEIRIVRTSDGHPVESALRDTVYDEVGWLPDGSHVIYNGAAKSGAGATSAQRFLGARVHLHTLDRPQSSDVAIFGTEVSPLVDVPADAFAFVDTPLGSTFAIAEVRDTGNRGSRFYVAPQAALASPSIPWRALGGAADGFTDYAVHGDTIDLATAQAAPNFRIVRASLREPFQAHTVLPEDSRRVVSGTLDGIPKAGIFALNAAADADYVQLLDRGASEVVRLPWTAHPVAQNVTLPLAGTVLTIAADARRSGAFFDLTNWTDPGDLYAYVPGAKPLATGWRHTTIEAAQARISEELEATAADGTHVPVSVVHRASDPLDGSRPVLLQVIGAYGFATTPAYSVVPAAWLALGGVYAVAHVRGGGELGERWRAGGRGQSKANSWNDLIACANVLVAKGYAVPSRLELYGPSVSYLGGAAAGIAIGRAMEERPDLFRAAVVDAGAFDLVRAETTFTGRLSTEEFGTTATRAGFDELFAMSPYAHVRDGVRYPTMLVRSFSKISVGDDWQSAKMIARLQEAARDPAAGYFDVPQSRAAARVDTYAFLLGQAATSRP